MASVLKVVQREDDAKALMKPEGILLTRYEIARLIGLRALQLDEGSPPFIVVKDDDNSLSIAAREIYERKLNALVNRNGDYHQIMTARFPRDLEITLNLLRRQ